MPLSDLERSLQLSVTSLWPTSWKYSIHHLRNYYNDRLSYHWHFYCHVRREVGGGGYFSMSREVSTYKQAEKVQRTHIGLVTTQD